MRVLASGAVVALAASMLLGGTGPASASNGDAITAGNDTSETYGTSVVNTATSQSCPTDTSFVALYGCGSLGVGGDGFIGVAGNGSGFGVVGHSDHTGVSGDGRSTGTGVEGLTETGTGVHGFSGGSTGIGVWGEGSGTGSAVYGQADDNGVGVFGDTTDGTGVEARSTTGKALRVIGTSEFSRSGLATVSSGHKSKKVIGVQGAPLTSATMVMATIQGNVNGVWLQGVQPILGTSSFVIYLNKAPTANVTVAWFIVEKPS